MESGLTYEEIVEILLRQDELLGLYRNQLKELTKEYDADDELIELTQLRSPRLNSKEKHTVKPCMKKCSVY